jgi:tetratricopeptide (TPR) repeat protein
MSPTPRTRPTNRWKALAFRLAAVGVGLSPLLFLEAALRAFGVGRSVMVDDPFVSFAASRPLFVPDASGERMEVSPDRLTWFRPESFPRLKPPGQFRVFALGGSTVQGEPYGIETSFTTWLELSLCSAEPDRTWDVVNCGGLSYASYRLLPILEEVLRYDPDLIIVYTGQNEFLEERTYRSFKRLPGWIYSIHGLLDNSRTYNFARKVLLMNTGRTRADRDVLPADVEALLDFKGGLEEYRRDDALRDAVMAHFELNLRRMKFLCDEAGVPLILVNPVCNLSDARPFKSQHRDSLDPRELEEFDRLMAESYGRSSSDLPGSVRRLRKAVEIDNQYAEARYELGKCLESLGRFEEARDHFLAAKDLDVCPLRILESMNESVLQVAADTDTPLVDFRRLIEDRSQGRIPSGEWLVDHVHPGFEGHKLLAHSLFEQMEQLQMVRPATGWKAVRDQAYDRHFASLTDFYFLDGQRHLKSLMMWAHGRSSQERPRPRGQDSPAAPRLPAGTLNR